MELKTSYEVGVKLEPFYSGGALAVSPDGSLLACACYQEVKVWFFLLASSSASNFHALTEHAIFSCPNLHALNEFDQVPIYLKPSQKYKQFDCRRNANLSKQAHDVLRTSMSSRHLLSPNSIFFKVYWSRLLHFCWFRKWYENQHATLHFALLGGAFTI